MQCLSMALKAVLALPVSSALSVSHFHPLALCCSRRSGHHWKVPTRCLLDDLLACLGLPGQSAQSIPSRMRALLYWRLCGHGRAPPKCQPSHAVFQPRKVAREQAPRNLCRNCLLHSCRSSYTTTPARVRSLDSVQSMCILPAQLPCWRPIDRVSQVFPGFLSNHISRAFLQSPLSRALPRHPPLVQSLPLLSQQPTRNSDLQSGSEGPSQHW